MDRAYEKFSQSKIDLAPLGLEPHRDQPLYFCTPKGASVFGWAGIDGIHFCFIRRFGGMVFSVSPMNTPQNHVHPLAENFTDFLRLLLACGHTAALEQAWMWDKSQFETFLQKNPPTREQKEVLTRISENMDLMPMENPWAYLKALQSGFDYSKIRYTEDYYDIDMNPAAERSVPEWKVYFSGNFGGHHGREHAGKEIQIHKQFDWAGRHWIIPAVYSCGKGLVIDFCMQVETERIRSFMERWNLSPENDSCESFTHEEQMQMESENPLHLDFSPHVELNGKTLQASHGCSVSYHPCFPDKIAHDLTVSRVMEHYELDTSCGWVIYRNAFLWKNKRCPAVKALSLTMKQNQIQLPGPHFTISEPGASFTFLSPVSGMPHILTAQEIKSQTFPKNRFGSDDWVYPTHFTAMSYTLSPEPVDRITIYDCAESDKPLATAQDGDPFRPAAKSARAISIIGGADGPTEMILETNTHEKLHTAYSALHFKPVQGPVEWQITFHTRQFEDAAFSLI